jgi:hypothetical protein
MSQGEWVRRLSVDRMANLCAGILVATIATTAFSSPVLTSLWHYVFLIPALGLAYLALFELTQYLVGRWRFRSWYGDWFYLTGANITSPVQDGGFAWMRFFLKRGQLHYVVRRYRTFEDLKAKYGAEADQKQEVGAVSEAISFDRKTNVLVVFYSAFFEDRTAPPRKGRLELRRQGFLAAQGYYQSVVPDGETHKASTGNMYAARKMVRSR